MLFAHSMVTFNPCVSVKLFLNNSVKNYPLHCSLQQEDKDSPRFIQIKRFASSQFPSRSLPRTSMAHPKHISHSSSHTCCTACLQISAQHVSNTDVHQTHATDSAKPIHIRAVHAAHALNQHSNALVSHDPAALSHRHKEEFTASLCYLEIYACILSFPANICITLTLTALSSLATSLSAFTAVQATSLFLYLSLSHFCLSLANHLIAAIAALSITVRFSYLPHPLNHIFTVPHFSRLTCPQLGAFLQLLSTCLLYSPSLFVLSLFVPLLTCVTTVHFLLLSDFPLSMSVLNYNTAAQCLSHTTSTAKTAISYSPKVSHAVR